jgi:hypothetical protein
MITIAGIFLLFISNPLFLVFCYLERQVQTWAGGLSDERKSNHAISCRHRFHLQVQKMIC